uniref:Uncharacterized protein n=1 Tax=Rhizophora mucronata TaxID=61149 RepID=A0A2P2NCL4_RHIMU
MHSILGAALFHWKVEDRTFAWIPMEPWSSKDG